MVKQKELKPFRTSEQQSSGDVATTAVTQPLRGDDIAWRHFPQFEKTFETERLQSMLQKIEKTCKHLDQFIQSGSAQQKSRAQAAMGAYGRTLDLLRQLSELKEKMANQK